MASLGPSAFGAAAGQTSRGGEQPGPRVGAHARRGEPRPGAAPGLGRGRALCSPARGRACLRGPAAGGRDEGRSRGG